jgi:hypothetical protein
MASSLHHFIYEVGGLVKLLSTRTIGRVIKPQPRKLLLEKQGHVFYIQCVKRNEKSKRYKVCRKFCCHCDCT